MIEQLFTISRHTFIESIRQPIFVVLLLVSALALVLNPSLAAYTLGDDNKLMIDMGLSTLFLTGLLLAAFTATGVLSDELENKTAMTVISKPVSRPVFVIGKYLGVSGAIAIAFWILAVIFLLTARHRVLQAASDPFDGPVLLFGITAAVVAFAAAMMSNYFYHRPFTSTFVMLICAFMTLSWFLVLLVDKKWQFQSPSVDFDTQMMIGLLMIFEAVLILAALAVAVSTRLGQIMTLTVCAAVFGLGLISDYLFGRFAQQYIVAKAFYLFVPNLQLFWPADALTQGHSFTVGYLGLVTAYSFLFTIALMGLAVCLFQQREIH